MRFVFSSCDLSQLHLRFNLAKRFFCMLWSSFSMLRNAELGRWMKLRRAKFLKTHTNTSICFSFFHCEPWLFTLCCVVIRLTPLNSARRCCRACKPFIECKTWRLRLAHSLLLLASQFWHIAYLKRKRKQKHHNKYWCQKPNAIEWIMP